MKQVKSLFIVVVLMFGALQFANAQKVAHVNMKQLMENHPDLLNAQKQVQTMADNYDKDYRGMVTEFSAKRDKYVAEEETVSETVNIERATELQNMQKSIQDFMADAQKKLAEKEQELTVPISEKVLAAIKKVGKAKGYEFVLDSTIGSGVLMADGPDLLADVKKELGIK